MDPSCHRWGTTDDALRQKAERNVSTAKDLLAAGELERCWELLIQAITVDERAPGADVLLVAATALRAPQRRRLPSGAPDPTSRDSAVPTSRDPAVIESLYRQASDLLNRCHPRDPCSAAFADAWAFLSDPHRKAALDSANEALKAAETSAYEAFQAALAETAAAPVPTAPCRSEEMPKRPIGQKPAKNAAPTVDRQSKRPRSDDDDGNSKESAIDQDKFDNFSKFQEQEETNANRIKVLELQQKLSSEKLETTKLAHLTALETKEEKKLILEAKKVEKESKMMDAYNNLISQDTSSMSDEAKAERVVAMKCLRKAFFPETI